MELKKSEAFVLVGSPKNFRVLINSLLVTLLRTFNSSSAFSQDSEKGWKQTKQKYTMYCCIIACICDAKS